MATNGDGKQHIVILGGGIIGASSLYQIVHHARFSSATHHVTLLESADHLAPGASGKAGGLLAKWAHATPQELVDLSWRIHADLADRHNGADRWGYRRLKAGQVNCVARSEACNGGEKINRARGVPKDLDWLDAESLKGYEEIGDDTETAQVMPKLFTEAMAELAKEKGGEAVSICTSSHVEAIGYASGSSRQVDSITYSSADGEKHTIPAQTVIASLGPWTRSLFPTAPITSQRAHSLSLKPSTGSVTPYALFTHITRLKPSHYAAYSATEQKPTERVHDPHRFSSSDASVSAEPELYARPDGTVYACGATDDLVPLPSKAVDVEVDASRVSALRAQVSAISSALHGGTVEGETRACYLPFHSARQGGAPVIGLVEGVKGLVVATGHTCWGICNSTGTGRVVAELVLNGRGIDGVESLSRAGRAQLVVPGNKGGWSS